MDDTLNKEQLEKRLEWLDNERRNDKTIIASLETKLDTLQTQNSTLKTRVAEVESGIARINTLLARQEQFELEINDLRKETARLIDGFQSDVQDKHVQTSRNQQKIEDLDTEVIGLRKRIQELDEINQALEKRKEEDIRLARLIETLKAQVNEIGRFDEDYKRALRVLEENRHQDTKRLTDVQGEVSAIRKRQDDVRNKQDLVGDNVRKLDIRIKDLLEAESERREAQTVFIEKLNMAQVERERTFNQWSERFEEMGQITANLEEKITDLENTHRAVKQSQAALDEVTQRFDRRVNEITEVQRLNEDRFRQEWTTFKSDDQKRWTNYVLSQEEQHREMNRNLENTTSQIEILEEQLKEIQRNLQQMGKNDLKRMQSLFNTFRESIENHDNSFNE